MTEKDHYDKEEPSLRVIGLLSQLRYYCDNDTIIVTMKALLLH